MSEAAMAARRLPGRRVAELTWSDDAAVDTALLARIVTGDQGAVGELYDRHCRLLFGLVWRMLGDRAAAEDLLHQCFLGLWLKAEQYDDSMGSPVAWLVGLARRQAIEHLRSNRTQTPPIVEPPAGRAVDHHDTDASRSAAGAAIRSALATLPLLQRDLILQAYFQGDTVAELAGRFGVPRGTVQAHLRDGLIALRDHLAMGPETS